MRLWQVANQADADATLTLTNLAANSSGWWSLEHLDPAGVVTSVGHVPPAGGPVATGTVTIPYDAAWAGSIQEFQWIVVAVTPDRSDITPMEQIAQGGVAGTPTDGLGNALPAPSTPVTPDLKTNTKTACPFSIEYP
jgi:hypothetical protein